MERVCVTRTVKNARHLQRVAPDLIPLKEPLDGFASLIPGDLLGKMHVAGPEATENKRLAELLAKKGVPRGGTRAMAPLFNGSIHFVEATFNTAQGTFAVSESDLKTAAEFSGLAEAPISRYAAQYGPNGVSVAAQPVPFSVSLSGGKYNDQTLAGWVDQLTNQNGFPRQDCLAFLNPQGVLNTDADASKGILGYHSVSPGAMPYVFVNVMGSRFTVQDLDDYYALALSHEIAEMVVDPGANGSNPEVCDGCGPNCQPVLRDYFDSAGGYVETSTGFPPAFQFGFYINAIVKPGAATQCPAPSSACAYPPP